MIDLPYLRKRIRKTAGLARKLVSKEPGPVQPDMGESYLRRTMLAVWGRRTIDGRMFAFRNLDWLSQAGRHDEHLITVVHGREAIPIVSAGFAGVTGCLAA